MNTPQTLKGFRDFLPDVKKKRDWLQSQMTRVFQQFGFQPLETPTLEYADLLTGKYGDEADKLLYTFEDRGGRKVGLRYDQTVPTARILSQYAHALPKFFRRYQIQPVFRADKPQKGRYREFLQCDIDIYGTKTSIADAEVLACTYNVYKELNFPSIQIQINDRAILINTLSPFATNDVNVYSIIQIIDKLEKLTKQDVIQELIKKGLEKENAEELLKKIEQAEITQALEKIIEHAQQLGVPRDALQYKPTLARGLDYYTGMIVEVKVSDEELSVAAGGRYDNLIHELGGRDVPAVGLSFGFDRTFEVAEKHGLVHIGDDELYLVTMFNPDLMPVSLDVANKLRESGKRVEIYTEPNDKLGKQLKYAVEIGADLAVLIGPDEVKEGVVTMKNLNERTESRVSLTSLIKTP